MTKTLTLSVLFTVYFLAAVYGQTVTVSTATYFDTPVGGGTTPIMCRDRAEQTSYGGPTQNPCSNSGFATPPVDQSRWGKPGGNDYTKMSGLGFQGIVSQTVTANQDFYLGQLTHFNWPINAGTAVYSVNMNVFLRFTVPGSSTPTSKLFTFKMLVDETPNAEPCTYPGTTPCADKISFNSSFNFQTNFEIDNSGVKYTLILEGFKESNVSSSSPVNYFISNENGLSNGFLFARITAACPSSCVNNGKFIITPDNQCACDCAGVTCPGIKVTAPDCSCTCPSNINCNGGTVNSNTCACQCSNTCPSPQVRDDSDCSCGCPANYCHVGGTVSNPTTCDCSCPTTACSITNQVRNKTCDCVCNVQCTSPKIRSTDPNVCGCVCPTSTCNPGFTANSTTCGCDCTKTCINSNLIKSNCSCGPCAGNWVKDGNGQCTVCPSTTTCPGAGKLDTKTCQCNCNLTCNIDAGDVIDVNAACACRKCVAGECKCGNGLVEPGEQCDPGNNNDPCCQNCRFTTNTCDDGNACTTGERCSGTSSGQGACNPGEYKCDASTECQDITCDPAVGVCNVANHADNSTCGPTADLCNFRCISGVCDKTPVVCPSDTNQTDCRHQVCEPTTGSCPFVADADATGCSDNNACTQNDQCTAGVCVGKAIECPAPDQCHNATCKFGVCVPYNLEDIPCNADDNLCTVGDVCSGGSCIPGLPKVCNTTGQCDSASCDSMTGQCQSFVVDNSLNKTCDDGNICTFQDVCTNGTCAGVNNPALVNATECGFIPIINATPKQVKNTSIIIFAVAGAAALIGAIAGLAFLIKKIRDSKLLNPDTWNPDTFSSLASNPLYKGSEKAMDNALYERKV